MAEIVTFELFHKHGDRLLFAALNPSSVGDLTLPTGDVAVGPAVEARVNHGRWIADCPTEGCHGAELVSFDNPVFFCCACRNAAAANAYLPVLVPGRNDRDTIEGTLLERPALATRNWLPGEAAADLVAETRMLRKGA